MPSVAHVGKSVNVSMRDAHALVIIFFRINDALTIEETNFRWNARWQVINANKE